MMSRECVMSLEYLPNELLIKIFSFLTLKDCDEIYGKLNHRFNSIIHAQRFHVEFNHHKYSNLSSLSLNIESATAEHFLYYNLSKILPKLSNLRELSVSRSLSNKEFESINPGLIKLQMPAGFFIQPDITMFNVRHLILNSLCCATIHKIAITFPNIEIFETVSPFCCLNIPRHYLKPCLNLKSLIINVKVTGSDIQAVLFEVAYVNKISIISNRPDLEMTNKQFDEILITLPNLDIGIRPPIYTSDGTSPFNKSLIITRRVS